jgi:hypothetical protein
VSEATIKAHVSAILQKLGVDNRTQAVILLSRIGTDPQAGQVSATRSCELHRLHRASEMVHSSFL